MTVGAPVPLTGRYAVQGAQVRAGLEGWARHAGTRLLVLDDRSDPARSAAIHAELAERGCRFVLGPYGSDSVRAVARARLGAVIWNHGAAADDVQRLPGVVSVPSPASRYLVALGRAVAELRPGARVAVLTAAGRFARFARSGFEREASALGVEIVAGPDEADAVLLCGPLEWEAEWLHRLHTGRRALLIGGVSPGLASFAEIVRPSDGVLAPVQWHPSVPVEPELGPRSVELEDYVGAQAYAVCLIADRCLADEPDDPAAAGRRLRTTTFFGSFALGPDGLQVGHSLSVIRWHRGRRELLLATAA